MQLAVHSILITKYFSLTKLYRNLFLTVLEGEKFKISAAVTSVFCEEESSSAL